MGRLSVCIFAFFVSLGCVSGERGPDWSRLDAFAGDVSREEFVELMEELYAPNADWRKWARVESDGVWIKRFANDPESEYFLAFSEEDSEVESEAEKVTDDALKGLRIAVDPGHIGGVWGEMEGRSFKVGNGRAVQEGDLTLATARRLQELLEQKGAVVWLTREKAEPVTDLRPADLLEAAAESIRVGGTEPVGGREKLAERLFYRTEEIKARAKDLNENFGADLAIVLHINAVAWPDPKALSLTTRNEGHVLVNGCYLEEELADDAMRFDLIHRLVNRYHEVELRLANVMARSMVEATGLPPYIYEGQNAERLDREGYVWARNLLANRTFDCPVVYLEPWIANSEAVYVWASCGDYEGELFLAGRSRRSLPAVYADFVMAGLQAYCDSMAASN